MWGNDWGSLWGNASTAAETWSVRLTASNAAGSNTLTRSNYIALSPTKASYFIPADVGGITTTGTPAGSAVTEDLQAQIDALKAKLAQIHALSAP